MKTKISLTKIVKTVVYLTNDIQKVSKRYRRDKEKTILIRDGTYLQLEIVYEKIYITLSKYKKETIKQLLHLRY